MHEINPTQHPAVPAARPPRGSPDPFTRRGPPRFSWVRLGQVAAVSAGGALGGSMRYAVERDLPRADSGFPSATFTVNVTGSFVLAVLLVLILDLWPPRRYVRPFVCVGFLGAFTTYSSLTVEFDQLVTDGSPGVAVAYLALTMLAGFVSAAGGLLIGHLITRRRQPDARVPEEMP